MLSPFCFDSDTIDNVYVYFQALQNFGTSHVLDMYLMGLSSQCGISSSEVKDFQYRAACCNANWNIKVPPRSASASYKLEH